MQENRIFLSEIALLGAWLGAPTYLLGLVVEVVIMARRGLLARGQRLRTAALLLAGLGFSYLATFLVWIAVPSDLLIWPGATGDIPFIFLGLFLTPAVVATSVVGVGVVWYGVVAGRRKAPEGERGSPTSG